MRFTAAFFAILAAVLASASESPDLCGDLGKRGYTFHWNVYSTDPVTGAALISRREATYTGELISLDNVTQEVSAKVHPENEFREVLKLGPRFCKLQEEDEEINFCFEIDECVLAYTWTRNADKFTIVQKIAQAYPEEIEQTFFERTFLEIFETLNNLETTVVNQILGRDNWRLLLITLAENWLTLLVTPVVILFVSAYSLMVLSSSKKRVYDVSRDSEYAKLMKDDAKKAPKDKKQKKGQRKKHEAGDA
ncbi:hypothetical protein L596_025525 [Steinernema carpocapsae]|uniref:Uncharacterized protein n=1 Tax=Steinernema carpocapsae TaxID=34508 RepID=A0A4U5M825_STECR|nr:hypothetical protein L596_025525 [Steinernema carpocapsae]